MPSFWAPGAAGLSVALSLADRGVRPLILDRAENVALSWRGRYDRLRLNTSRPFSHLPVRLLSPLAVIPAWPGKANFAGTILHSSEYRNPSVFQDKAVLVVGPGCSGMEIAHDLAMGGAAKVWLAVRTPPNILLRTSPGPVPSDIIGVALMKFPTKFADTVTRYGQRSDFGDLREYGLPFPEVGVFARIARGEGEPTVRGEKAAAQGLRFVGFVPRPGALGYIAKEAKLAAKAIAREIQKVETA